MLSPSSQQARGQERGTGLGRPEPSPCSSLQMQEEAASGRTWWWRVISGGQWAEGKLGASGGPHTVLCMCVRPATTKDMKTTTAMTSNLVIPSQGEAIGIAVCTQGIWYTKVLGAI